MPSQLLWWPARCCVKVENHVGAQTCERQLLPLNSLARQLRTRLVYFRFHCSTGSLPVGFSQNASLLSSPAQTCEPSEKMILFHITANDLIFSKIIMVA